MNKYDKQAAVTKNKIDFQFSNHLSVLTIHEAQEIPQFPRKIKQKKKKITTFFSFPGTIKSTLISKNNATLKQTLPKVVLILATIKISQLRL